jgi:hypothetical protein
VLHQPSTIVHGFDIVPQVRLRKPCHVGRWLKPEVGARVDPGVLPGSRWCELVQDELHIIGEC